MNIHATFDGSMPDFYDRFLGPAWFDPYGENLASRLPPRPAGGVLELACGTGLVTKWIRGRVDPATRVVATDLNEAMLEYARRKHADLDGVEWRTADATRLPFADGEFGAVVCGFGIMFVPDPAAALREARRVLANEGLLVFNVWDRIESNPTALVNAEVVEGLFPGDPEVRFRTPFEMHDTGLLRRMLGDARFRERRIEPTEVAIHAPSARDVAVGQIRGTPRSALLEKKGASLDDVIEKVATRLATVGGAAPYRATARAIVVEAVAD